MRSIGSYELKSHLSEVLDAVEHGHSVIVTRHGKPIARIVPDDSAAREQARQAADGLRAFTRTKLPAGTSLRSLIEEGRR